ncbi:hypothetical protein Sru01_55290 [Sphaerisporangium rufum]|uniref:histidine kinase n=1 Tax=Sphaerisporangium rufum TaxID=1381558 RepID=A0A919V389_9ACTN|nr:nitrate- and nitrite sensing domain-containing protein [Sphaerisporangium rufum]GII80547.1 hypothetical protein Sru01_55290 [Sphaerisporangium rufum]
MPTTVAVLLGGFRVASSIQSATEYERVRTVADFVIAVNDLVHELDYERDLTARYVAAGRAGNQDRLIKDQQGEVDAVAQKVLDGRETAESALGDAGRQKLTAIVDRINQLPLLRQAAVGKNTNLPALPVLDKYNLVIDDLLAMLDETARGSTDEGLDSSSAAFASLARSAEQAARQRGLMVIALVERQFTVNGLKAFNAASAQQGTELSGFFLRATQEQRQKYFDKVTGQRVDRAGAIVARVLFLTNEGTPLFQQRVGQSIDAWMEASGFQLDQMHDTVRDLGRSIVARAADLARTDQSQAAVNIGVVALLIILVLVITTVMARSLVIPLRRLRREALEIAGRRLPDTVQRLRESEGNSGPPDVQPIGVSSKDEVGEVARAFDEVHREAIRLASDEAQLRSNVSAMFVNLSRRTQTLVERQIALIDGLEQGEQDDKRLGDLFRLDHLATRMRRNSENLLVLAGQEPARRWSQPVPLLDVTRASLSEVENYERVAMNVPAGITLAGQAVNDVIHLLAELVENAISFSPRETRVTLSANRIDGGGVMISITDAGIGMTEEELAQTNWRLANPPVVDVSVSRRMGLFVVGRLALRNGIRVQLRRHDSGGLTAMVLLPESLMGSPAGQGAGGAPAAQPTFAGGSAWSGTGQPAGQGAFAGQGAGFDTPGPGLFGGSFPEAGTFGAPATAGPLGPTTGGGLNGPDSFGSYGGQPNGSGAFGGTPAGAGTFGGAVQGGPYGPGTGGYGGGFDGPPTGGGYAGPPTGGGAAGPASFGGPPTGPGQFATPAPSAFGGPPTGPAGQPTGPSLFGPPTGDTPGNAGRARPRRYDSSDLDAVTGPLPAVRNNPMEHGDEFLPIFASVESAWFRRVDREPDQEQTVSTPAWEAPADAGWQAAAVVQEPVRDGTTAAGLPKRVPKANLVPGSASAAAAGAAPSPAPAMPALSPDRARSRLSSFQQGIRQGRAVARGELSENEVAFKADLWRTQGDKEDK